MICLLSPADHPGEPALEVQTASLLGKRVVIVMIVIIVNLVILVIFSNTSNNSSDNNRNSRNNSNNSHIIVIKMLNLHLHLVSLAKGSSERSSTLTELAL